MSLKSKITVFVLLTFLGCIGALVQAVSTRLERDLVSLLSAQQFSIASYIADDVDNNLQQRIDAMSGHAAYVTPEMLADPEKARAFLKERVTLRNMFKAGLVFVAKDGKGIADYPHIPERQSGRFDALEYFQAVLATGKPAIGRARIGRFTKLPGIAVAVPVKNVRGEVLALFVGFATLSDSSLFGRVEKANIGRSGDIFIDDPRYRLTVTSSDHARILAPMPQPGINAMLDRFAAGFEGSGISMNSKGEEVLTSAKRIPASGWIVRIVLPTAEAYAPIRDMKAAVLRIALAMSLLVAFLAWLLVRRVFRPLDTASASIRSMVDGASALTALPVARNDEIGGLLTSFNRLLMQRKRIHEALKESEQRFRTVADYNYDWEYWRGADRKLIYMSQACERITGYALAEFEADHGLIGRIVHPDDRTMMTNHLSDYRSDAEHALDFRILRKDGGLRWIAHGCRPVYGKDGEFMGRRVSNRDITERKQAEAELREAKEQLLLALEASSLSMWDFDIGAGLVRLDNRWASLVGDPAGLTVSRAEALVGRVHASDKERIVKSAMSAGKGVAPFFQEEFRFRTGSGDWKWIRCSGKVTERDAAGRAVRAIGTILDIHERKAAEERIRQLAYYDTLTELPNRRLLLGRLNQAYSQAKRYRRSLAVMFLDLDNFKQINDTLGHEAGDELLKEVANRLAGCIRNGDTLSRQGGDEFVIVLSEIDRPDSAAMVAEKILKALNQPVRVAGQERNVTASIGVSVYPVDGGDDVQELMKKADMAMYAAKKAGRNRYQFFEGLERSDDVRAG